MANKEQKPLRKTSEARRKSVKKHQDKLRAKGICLSCCRRKANRGAGSTLRFCAKCAEAVRKRARDYYRAKKGKPLDDPIAKTGRPYVKPRNK